MSGEEGGAAAPAAVAGAEGQEIEKGAEGKEKQKPRPIPKMRTVKVNGQVEHVDEEAVFRDYQKYRSGEEKLRTASEKQASIDAFYKRLEEDPEAVLTDKKLPIKRRELAMKWLTEELEEELAPNDPREKELKELRDKLKSHEDKEAEDKKKAMDDENTKLIESRKTAISTVLSEAMKSSQLGDHPESAAATLREMAVFMRACKARGEDVTAEDLVQHIHNNRFHQMYTLAHQYEGDQLIEFLGEEIVNRIRKADIERIKKRRQTPVESYRSTAPRGQQQGGEPRYVDPTDERFALRAGR